MQGRWIGCFTLGTLLLSSLTWSLQLRVGGFMHGQQHMDLNSAVVQDQIVDIARQHHLFYLRGVLPSKAARLIMQRARSSLYSCREFRNGRSVVLVIVFYRRDVIRLRLPYGGPLEQSGLISPVVGFCVQLLRGFQMSFAVLGVNLQAVRSESDGVLELADQVAALEQYPDFPLVIIGQSVRPASNIYRDDYRVLEYVSADPRHLQKSFIAVRGSIRQTVTQTEPMQLGDWYSGMDLPIGFTLDVYNLQVATKQQLRIQPAASLKPNKNQQQRIGWFSPPAQQQSTAIATTSSLPGSPHIDGADNQWYQQDPRYQPLLPTVRPQSPRKRTRRRRHRKQPRPPPTQQQPHSSQQKPPFYLPEQHVGQQQPPLNSTQPHNSQQQPPFYIPQPQSSQQQSPSYLPQPHNIQQQPPFNPTQSHVTQQHPPFNQPEPHSSQQKPAFNQPQQYKTATRTMNDQLLEGEMHLQQALAAVRQQGEKNRQQPESDVEPDSRFRQQHTAITTYDSPRTHGTDILWTSHNQPVPHRPEDQSTSPQNHPQPYISQQHSPFHPQQQHETAAGVIYEQILQSELELQQALDVVIQREGSTRHQHQSHLYSGGGSMNQRTDQPQPLFDLSPPSLHEPQQHQREPQPLFSQPPPSFHEPQQHQREPQPLFDLSPPSFHEPQHQREPQPLFDLPQPHPYHAPSSQQPSDIRLWSIWEEVPASHLHAPATDMVDQQLLQGEKELQQALDKVIRQNSGEQWTSRSRQQDTHDLEPLDDIFNDETVRKPST